MHIVTTATVKHRQDERNEDWKWILDEFQFEKNIEK